MTTGFLLVPALAGYWVLSRTYVTHFIVDRHVGYRFLFEMAIVGLTILAVAWWISNVSGLGEAAWLSWLTDRWSRWVPFKYSGTLAITGIIAGVVPAAVNWLIPAQVAAAWRAPESESRFGWLLRESLEKGLLVEISTTTGKSYIGYVLEEDPRQWERDVALLPVLSGYRDPTTSRLRITTNYSRLPSEWMENYAVTIAMKEVVSINRFEPRVYQAMRAAREREERQSE